jgi:hypothetical protein
MGDVKRLNRKLSAPVTNECRNSRCILFIAWQCYYPYDRFGWLGFRFGHRGDEKHRCPESTPGPLTPGIAIELSRVVRSVEVMFSLCTPWRNMWAHFFPNLGNICGWVARPLVERTVWSKILLERSLGSYKFEEHLQTIVEEDTMWWIRFRMW